MRLGHWPPSHASNFQTHSWPGVEYNFLHFLPAPIDYLLSQPLPSIFSSSFSPALLP